MAHRIAVHGLHRTATDPTRAAVLDLGVQDGTRNNALLAMVARVDATLTGATLAADPGLVLLWSYRGAQHLHRRDGLGEVLRSLVPLDESDAMARVGWNRKQVTEAGMSATEALFTSAAALRAAVPRPMAKGEASGAVTALLPAGLSYDCRGCGTRHILEQLFRVCAPHAGIRLEPGASPAVLAPLEQRGPIRTEPDPAAATEVVGRYLRLHGPARPADAAGFAGTTATSVRSVWPDGLTEVRVDGARRWLPDELVDQLAGPPEPDPVRLLPAWDPLLQGRDRDLLVPDRARQKQVWRMLGNPGVLLAGGEIAGTWRVGSGGGTRLDLELHPFEALGPRLRAAARDEAQRVALARGRHDSRLTQI